MAHERRVREYMIAGPLICDMMTEGWTTGDERISVVRGLPAGAEIINTAMDFHGNVRLLIRHESFDPVLYPESPPLHTVTYRREVA